MDCQHQKLMNNTAMLYILTFSNYLFNFITIPFQTRVLGPEFFAKLSFGMAFAAYFQLIFDFGFILSATEDVAKHHGDKMYLNHVYSSVTIAKMCLIGGSVLVFGVLLFTITSLRQESLILILYFAGFAVNALFPDFLYRGLQIMRSITIRSVGIKALFCVLIFIFLKKPEQYYFIPLFQLVGNMIALLFVYLHISRRLQIHFIRVKWSEVGGQFRRASVFFFSRIATSAYTTTNTFIMGLFYGSGSPLLGYFSSADKTINVAKQGINPIVDSLYPHMVEHHDYRFLKKVIQFIVPILLIGILMVDMFAEPICSLVFGEAFRESAYYLRLMSPVVLISFMGMTFGFPVLSPIGLSKYANLSVIAASIVHLIGLGILYVVGSLNLTAICLLTLLTELNIFLFRLLVFMGYYHQQKKGVRRNYGEKF